MSSKIILLRSAFSVSRLTRSREIPPIPSALCARASGPRIPTAGASCSTVVMAIKRGGRPSVCAGCGIVALAGPSGISPGSSFSSTPVAIAGASCPISCGGAVPHTLHSSVRASDTRCVAASFLMCSKRGSSGSAPNSSSITRPNRRPRPTPARMSTIRRSSAGAAFSTSTTFLLNPRPPKARLFFLTIF